MKYIHSIDRGENVAQIRDEVAEFAVVMEQKLRKKDHKTHWRDQPIEAHLKLLKIELMEFEIANEFFGDEEACNELIDIGAYAMIIRDKIKNRKKP